MKILEIRALLEEKNYTKKALNIVTLRAFFIEIYAVTEALHYSAICRFAYQHKYQQQHKQVRAPYSRFPYQ